ncbi:hypothetical protein FDX03_21505 [Citrobacter sp. wls827]|nr:hypothetical protein FDX03_21505 [Citrobacter sp. wls827]
MPGQACGERRRVTPAGCAGDRRCKGASRITFVVVGLTSVASSGKKLSEPGIKPGFFMQKKCGPEVRKSSRWL